MTAHSRSPPTDAEIDEMLSGPAGPKINWYNFISMFAEKMDGTDPEEVIRNAFGCFDPEGKGTIDETHLKKVLTTMGTNKTTEEEFDEMVAVSPSDQAGDFQYEAFSAML